MKKIMDGNTACASVAYKMSQVAPIYPITPSSTMAELCDAWSVENEKNIFNQTLDVVELQSEAGASGALHGALRSGALATTFTASQGLLLMIPNMYKMAGECLPAVIHVSARAIATHALSIYGDHSDVMACRTTGFNMICASSPQEAHDMALVSHLSALDASLPFLHFFDGFRTSHELCEVETLSLDEIKSLVDYKKVENFRKRGLSNAHPEQSGTSQGADVYFANREASNILYNAVPKIVQENFDKVARITGRQYHLFDYYGSDNAKNIIVLMGSASNIAVETLDALKDKYSDFGVLCVRLYRPFSLEHFINALPKTTEKICVLDRTKESGALGEPLFIDVASAVQQANLNIKVIGGRYGLGSFEFNPAMVKAVMDNMISENPKNHFTVGINDDVTHTSLEIEDFNIEDDNTKCVFIGLGGDGTVSANKNSAKIIGDVGGYHTQAYFVYDSKKSGSMTLSHLRFGAKEIKSSYQIKSADFLAVHNPTFLSKLDILQFLKQNGTLLLNIPIENGKINVPQNVKDEIIRKNAKVYAINAVALAREIGLKNKINIIMQTAFFYLSNVIPFDNAKIEMEKSIKKSYSKFGEEVVANNIKAISLTCDKLQEIKYDNILIDENLGKTKQKAVDNQFYNEIMTPIAKLNGDKIPVSKFSVDGFVPTDTSKFEKRGIATKLPKWKPEYCLQCNLCSFVCPHSAITPKLVDANENDESISKLPNAFGVKDKKFAITCSTLDCTGCGNCALICPAKNKAIEMQNAEDVQDDLQSFYDKFEDVKNPPQTILNSKTSQFNESLFKYSGACAGCGQTPYIKILTQLFGEEMVIANATGCSSIYAGSYPSCPYSKTKDGFGVAWANSLFEDNAEFGFGLKVGKDKQLENFESIKENACKQDKTLSKIFESFADKNTFADKKALYKELKSYLESKNKRNPQEEALLQNLDLIIPTSQWIIGGDGWAYDIGYGGLDHILASNADVNILVLDTEIYSNTGGQASKATPKGATAKFCAGGKQTAKKDLARIASAYPNTYVARVCLSANPQHTIKCMLDAKAHKGASIIIAYAPCVGQGVDLSFTPQLERLAVSSGYWELLHRNPNENNGEIIIDSPAPTTSLDEFMSFQARFKKLLSEKED